jgi:deazaflavin-dependent oxidoreductase (nitroreductase family)
MRKLAFLVATAAGLYGLVLWWRNHRRAGTDFMNRTVNPWLERHGLVGGKGSELGVIEHIGRKSGILRRTAIYPMPIPDGFRIIVPVGGASQWARNVLAAGRCRLLIRERTFDLDQPVLETPDEVPALPRPVRALFGWLGFRYLRLRTVSETPSGARDLVPEPEAVAA